MVRNVRKIVGVIRAERRNPTGFSLPSRMRERMRVLKAHRTKQTMMTTWKPPMGNRPAATTWKSESASPRMPPKNAPAADITPVVAAYQATYAVLFGCGVRVSMSWPEPSRIAKLRSPWTSAVTGRM